MTDSEFISSTHELRTLALRTGSAIVGTSCGEDIAQDAMLRLWNMRSDIRSAAHGRALAVSISRHLALDNLRRISPRPLPTALCVRRQAGSPRPMNVW